MRREVRVMSQLDHPNIAELLGVSYHLEGNPAIIMKWYELGNASKYIESRPDLPLKERLVLVRNLSLSIFATIHLPYDSCRASPTASITSIPGLQLLFMATSRQ